MLRDHTQEAYDEYYSTGIDPTGGDIEQYDIERNENYQHEEAPESLIAGIDRFE